MIARPLPLELFPEFSLFVDVSAIMFASLTLSVFVIAITEPSQWVVDGHHRAEGPNLFVHQFHGGGILVHILLEPFDLLGAQAARLA
jgi:hypothetical protein